MIIDRVPEAVEIAGEQWKIETDFRHWAQFERLMLCDAVTPEDKVQETYDLLYPVLPDDPQTAIDKVVWFWRCGIEHGGGSGVGASKQIYDLELDSGYIYSAFMADYGIDIEAIKTMHWWKFRHLMYNLRPDNLFCRILDYRGADLSKKKGEEKRHYEKMRKYYALPLPADEKAKQDIIMQALRGDGDVKGALKRAGLE